MRKYDENWTEAERQAELHALAFDLARICACELEEAGGKFKIFQYIEVPPEQGFSVLSTVPVCECSTTSNVIRFLMADDLGDKSEEYILRYFGWCWEEFHSPEPGDELFSRRKKPA